MSIKDMGVIKMVTVLRRSYLGMGLTSIVYWEKNTKLLCKELMKCLELVIQMILHYQVL